jgi:hypothetical protein
MSIAMRKVDNLLKHRFVTAIPSSLESGVLYISLEFDTAVHLCACGCGNEVVTPLSPAQWAFTYDGKSVSLYPSVGNWSFPCKSHYIVRRGEINWARKFDDKEIAKVRERDSRDLRRHTGSSDEDHFDPDPTSNFFGGRRTP